MASAIDSSASAAALTSMRGSLTLARETIDRLTSERQILLAQVRFLFFSLFFI